MRAVRLLEYAIEQKPKTVLDIATGPGKHAIPFIVNGSKVTGVDLKKAPFEHEDYTHFNAAYETLELDEQFDMVWSCHTLEHIPNVQHFLTQLHQWTKDGGWLAISVPPAANNRLHVGHLTAWSPALLAYNLICAGWDCSEAVWYTEYCTIGFMVQKKPEIDLSWRTGMPNEVQALRDYMPISVQHEDNAWWEDNWYEETEPVAVDPPAVTVGYQYSNMPPVNPLGYGPNPELRKKYERVKGL